MIERGVNVTLRVGWGTVTSGRFKVESFVVTSKSTKGYNKCYMCERGKQIWKKFLEARMIQRYHRLGRYEYVKPVGSKWGTESTFLLADGSYIKEEKGRVYFLL